MKEIDVPGGYIIRGAAEGLVKNAPAFCMFNGIRLEAQSTDDNPEAIVATGMGDAQPEWLHDWDKWTRMTAVKRDNLFHINPDIMQRHTPRILDGTEQLCDHLDVARTRRAAK